MLEAVISEHPDVVLAAVVARSDERWGERPVTMVQCRKPVTEKALREFLIQKAMEGRIAKFWILDLCS